MRLVHRTLIISSMILAALSSATANAELYIGGGLGYDFSSKFGNVQDTGFPSGLNGQDLSLKGAVTYGIKVGYFFDSLPWLGTEGEFFSSSPVFKQRVLNVRDPSTGGATTFVDDVQGHLTTNVLAWNVVVRYPSRHIEPYVGVGPGIFRFKHSAEDESETNTQVGLNALAGVRFFLSETWAVFTEYKYNYARLKFAPDFIEDGTGLKGKYSSNKAVLGLFYHF